MQRRYTHNHNQTNHFNVNNHICRPSHYGPKANIHQSRINDSDFKASSVGPRSFLRMPHYQQPIDANSRQNTPNKSISIPLIALPSLSSTNTNIKSSTNPRKRTATEMMDDEHPNKRRGVGTEPKRQKIQKKMKSKSINKVKNSIAILREFADNNSGRLPSLRFVMKKLRVGFPKAHEIMDQYAIVVGKAKCEVIQDMTVRQGNSGKKKSKGNKNKNNFAQRLNDLVEAVADDCEWDVFEKEYLSNLNRLELFLDEYVNAESIRLCDLQAKVNITTAFHILGEIYFFRCGNMQTGYTYNERALSVLSDNKSDNAYDGVFWREFASIFLLRGDMLLEYDDYAGARRDYELTLDLVFRVRNKALNGCSDAYIFEYLSKSLQKVTIIHCYLKNYELAIKYAKQFLGELINVSRIDIKSIIETKMWLSCNLMLSPKVPHYNEGFRYYKQVLMECNHKINPNDAFKYVVFCYFAVHFIRANVWDEVYLLMNKIFAINEYVIGDVLKEEMHKVFAVYVECIQTCLDTMTMDNYCSFRRKIYDVMRVLQVKHINIINEINLSAKKKEKEYREKNKTLKKRNKDENDEDIDLILSDKFNYNLENMLNSYPKINIVSVLINQITLLLSIGQVNAAHNILYDLVIPESKCLNKGSKYWQYYPIHKINEKEISDLLKLL